MPESVSQTNPPQTVVEQLRETADATRQAVKPIPGMYSYHGAPSNEGMIAKGKDGSESAIYYNADPSTLPQFRASHTSSGERGAVDVRMDAAASTELGVNKARTTLTRLNEDGEVVRTFESSNSNTARRVGKLIAGKVAEAAEAEQDRQEELGDTAELEVIEGASSFETASDTRLPVHIAIFEEEDEETGEPTGNWALMADGAVTQQDGETSVVEGLFGVRSQSLDKVRAVVEEQVLPIYETALEGLSDIAGNPSGTTEHGDVEAINEDSESFEAADAWNVPLHVQLRRELAEGTEEPTGFWALTADWYTPRKDKLEKDWFGVRSTDPEALKRIVATRVVPIYEAALEDLQGIVSGSQSSLYAWKVPPAHPTETTA